MSILDRQKLLLALASPGWRFVVDHSSPTTAISLAAMDGGMLDEEDLQVWIRTIFVIPYKKNCYYDRFPFN